MADPKSDVKIPLTVDAAVKLFDKQAITVSVVKTSKTGEPLRDPQTKGFVVEDKPLLAAHVLAVSERPGEIGITTIDGRKYVAATK